MKAILIVIILQGASHGKTESEYIMKSMNDCLTSLANIKIEIAKGEEAEQGVAAFCVQAED